MLFSGQEGEFEANYRRGREAGEGEQRREVLLGAAEQRRRQNKKKRGGRSSVVWSAMNPCNHRLGTYSSTGGYRGGERAPP